MQGVRSCITASSNGYAVEDAVIAEINTLKQVLIPYIKKVNTCFQVLTPCGNYKCYILTIFTLLPLTKPEVNVIVKTDPSNEYLAS